MGQAASRCVCLFGEAATGVQLAQKNSRGPLLHPFMTEATRFASLPRQGQSE